MSKQEPNEGPDGLLGFYSKKEVMSKDEAFRLQSKRFEFRKVRDTIYLYHTSLYEDLIPYNNELLVIRDPIELYELKECLEKVIAHMEQRLI